MSVSRYDSNGYAPSIMDTKPGTCYICGSQTETIRHEIFFGPNRGVSKRNGLWINICPVPRCHEWVHTHLNVNVDGELIDLDLHLKRECQKKYEETHTRDEWMSLMGRNYL